MKILRATDYKVMPWKNGLGSTTEIAISLASDGLSDFDWRVSMAQVTHDGPFSLFPGIDRTLMILEGDGIILTVANRAPARIDRAAIHSFPGDQATSASLTNGPIIDLNVMSRRDRMQHRVQRINVMNTQRFQASHLTLLVVEGGTIQVEREGACRDACGEGHAHARLSYIDCRNVICDTIDSHHHRILVIQLPPSDRF